MWWSLRPLPARSNGTIDGFLQAKLAEKKLTASPEADRRTLIRRLTFDLHGLPPSPAEVDVFVNDASPKAYESLVDRLLADFLQFFAGVAFNIYLHCLISLALIAARTAATAEIQFGPCKLGQFFAHLFLYVFR